MLHDVNHMLSRNMSSVQKGDVAMAKCIGSHKEDWPKFSLTKGMEWETKECIICMF